MFFFLTGFFDGEPFVVRSELIHRIEDVWRVLGGEGRELIGGDDEFFLEWRDRW